MMSGIYDNCCVIYLVCSIDNTPLTSMERELKERGKPTKDVTCKGSEDIICDLCEKGNIAFLCADCNEWMCVDCSTIHKKMKVSKDHILEPLLDCNENMKIKLNTKLDIFKKLIEQHPHKATMLTKEMTAVQIVQDEMLKESAYHRDKYIADIRKMFSEIDSQIRNYCVDEVKTLEEHSDVCKQQIENLQRIVNEIERIINDERDYLAIQGERLLLDAENLQHFVSDSEMTKPFKLKVVRWPSWNSSRKFELDCNRCESIQKKPVPDYSALAGLLKKQWQHQQKSVEIREEPFSLRLIDGQLWQCHRGGISVFTLDLKPIRQIHRGDMGAILDVADMGMEKVAVAANNGLYEFNNDGTITSNIAKGTFTSVCFYENQLFAAHQDSATIRIYTRHGGTWTKSSSFTVDKGSVTLSVNSVGVFMCVEQQSKFYHYSHSGELLSSTGSEGRGIREMKKPHLCTVDRAGTTMIADRGTMQLKLLSSNGTPIIIDLHPRQSFPLSALFYNDLLYVTSSEYVALGKNRLSMFA